MDIDSHIGVPSDESGLDPILALRGVGKSLWEGEGALAYVERMRSEEGYQVSFGEDQLPSNA